MPLGHRPADPTDLPFLTDMLAAAAHWRTEPPADLDVLAHPDLARYLTDWPRPHDLGIIATDPTPVGAAWLSHLPAENPGYGFLDPSIPELTLGVVAPRRGEGIGTGLLRTLLTAARVRDVPAVSLSVEPDNHAALRLYRRLEFREVGRNGGALTMLLTLS